MEEKKFLLIPSLFSEVHYFSEFENKYMDIIQGPDPKAAVFVLMNFVNDKLNEVPSFVEIFDMTQEEGLKLDIVVTELVDELIKKRRIFEFLLKWISNNQFKEEVGSIFFAYAMCLMTCTEKHIEINLTFLELFKNILFE